MRHSAKSFYFFLKIFFAECQPPGIRQRFFIFFKKNSLPSANPEGTRQSAFIFLLKIFFAECHPSRHSAKIFFLKLFAECQHGRHSAKFKFFFKISLLSVRVTALDKAGKFVFWSPILPALPSVVTIALGKGVLCRVQHSAK